MHRTRVYRLLLVIALALVTHAATVPVPSRLAETVNDKASHAVAFYVLAWLADFAFPARPFAARKSLVLLGYGLLIELLQAHLPNRTCSLLDAAADLLGILAYAASIPLLRRCPGLKTRWSGAPARG